MSEQLPAAAYAPGGAIEPGTAFAGVVAGFEAPSVEHPLGALETNVYARPAVQTDAPLIIHTPGVLEGTIVDKDAPLSPAEPTAGSAEVALRMPAATEHVGALATAAATRPVSRSASLARRPQNVRRIQRRPANLSANQIATALGGQPPGGNQPPALTLLPFTIDHSGRRPYGWHEARDQAGNKIPGRIGPQDRMEALSPLLPPMAATKGVPRFGPAEPARRGHWNWGARPMRWSKRGGYTLNPLTWFDRRGRGFNLIDPDNGDLQTGNRTGARTKPYFYK